MPSSSRSTFPVFVLLAAFVSLPLCAATALLPRLNLSPRFESGGTFLSDRTFQSCSASAPSGGPLCPDGNCCLAGQSCCSDGGCCGISSNCQTIGDVKGCCSGQTCTLEDKPESSLTPTPTATGSATGSATSSDDHGHDGSSTSTDDSSHGASSTPTTHNGDDTPSTTLTSTPTASAGFSLVVVDMSSSALTFTGDWVAGNSTTSCGASGTGKSVSGSAGVSVVNYTFTGTAIYVQSAAHDAHYSITLDEDITEFGAHDDSGSHDTRSLHLRASDNSNSNSNSNKDGSSSSDDSGSGHDTNDDNGGSGGNANGTCTYGYVRTGLADAAHTLEITVFGSNSNSSDTDAGDDHPGAGDKEWSFELESFAVIQKAGSANSSSGGNSSTGGNSNTNTTGGALSMKTSMGMVAELVAVGVWMVL